MERKEDFQDFISVQ